MKNLIKISFIFIICTSFKIIINKVYVCDSKTSVAYHNSKNCDGLDNCKHEIIYITKSDATVKYNKRACKICY